MSVDAYWARRMPRTYANLQPAVVEEEPKPIPLPRVITNPEKLRTARELVAGRQRGVFEMSRVIAIASEISGVPVNHITSRSRLPDRARARQFSVWLANKMLNRSLAGIGRTFGRDHTTVIYSIRKVEKDDSFAEWRDTAIRLIEEVENERLAQESDGEDTGDDCCSA